MFSHIERTSHTLVSLNLLELMCVAFLPVPVGILGTWVVSDRDRFFAVIFYGATLIVLGIIHNMTWWYVGYWARLTSTEMTDVKRRALTLTWIPGPILYAVCLGLAWIDPRISLVGFALLAIAYLLPTPRVLMQAQRVRAAKRTRPPRRPT
jgi:uncharacterized membrane protein